ncbi:MAG: AAA family ATPase [Candidatus Latescibacteria bacterium]|nr:AAA family ATPase [Candidatus Latescibacterota bacterium]
MSEKQPFSPAELQKDLKNFLEEKYGNQVVFPEGEAAGMQEGPHMEEPAEPTIDFDLKPEELEAYLNEYVVQQAEAKEVLATKICTHYNRMKLDREDPEFSHKNVGQIKNNILLMGPTGVGKTYLIKLIAQRIGVPFVKGDATKFSETGYVGGDVEDLIRELVHEADGSIEMAQYGIVYIDEIDKIASSSNQVGPDVSRTGVQRNLLKLMEETDVDLKAPHDLTSQMESMMQFQRSGKVERQKINTRNILFIVSGAFSGLDDIVRKRLNLGKVGFQSGRDISPEQDSTALLQYVKTEDLIKYGFESEFVGRLPVTAVLTPLSVDDLYAILQSQTSSVILGKQRDFKAYGIDLTFDDDALRLLAEQAALEQTGARSLVSVCERTLLKFEKSLPSTDIDSFHVTKKVIENPEHALQQLLVLRGTSAFVKRFQSAYGIALIFDDEALGALAEKSAKENRTVDEVCPDLFDDYGHGLKLLGHQSFVITAEAVRQPKNFLDSLVKAFYQGGQNKRIDE